MMRDATPMDASRVARLLQLTRGQWSPVPDRLPDEAALMEWTLAVILRGRVGVLELDGRILASVAIMPFLHPAGIGEILTTEWIVFHKRACNEEHRTAALGYINAVLSTETVAAGGRCPIMVHIPARLDPAGLEAWTSLEGHSKLMTVLVR